MSRTDKTRPLWVKMLEHPANYVEVHDHTDGRCELAGRAFEASDVHSCQRGACDLTWSPSFIGSGQSNCGCPICTDRDGRRRTRRKQRHQSRTITKTAAREFNRTAELEDL